MSTTALRRILAGGAALAAATALGAAPAHAAATPGIVEVTDNHLVFSAAEGATNQIEVYGTLDPIFSLIDRRSTLELDDSARTRCEQITANKIRCTGITLASFYLGDKSDSFDAGGYVPVRVWAGSGNDTLVAKLSRYDQTVPGTPARLYGQAGNDDLVGGEGDDVLHVGTGANQSADGGPGSDVCRGPVALKLNCEKD